MADVELTFGGLTAGYDAAEQKLVRALVAKVEAGEAEASELQIIHDMKACFGVRIA